MPKKFPRFKPGEQFGLRGPNGELILDKRAADLLNATADELRRLGKVSVTPPLRWTETPSGRRFACDFNPEIMAKLSGAGPQYSFVQQQYDPPTHTWSDMAGGRTGTNCYESKGKTGLAGKIVQITYAPTADDWRFQYVGYGCVADADHVCLCGCSHQIPKEFFFSDTLGSHTLVGGAGGTGGVWIADHTMVGIPLATCVGGSCALNTTGDLLVRYRLTLNCTTGIWTFGITWKACACTGGQARYSTDFQGTDITRSNTLSFDCEDFSLLEFNITTTSQGMDTPGGGGLISVVP